MTRFQAIRSALVDIGEELLDIVLMTLWVVALLIGGLVEFVLAMVGLGWLAVRFAPLTLAKFVVLTEKGTLFELFQQNFAVGMLIVLSIFFIYFLLNLGCLIIVEPVKHIVKKYKMYRGW